MRKWDGIASFLGMSLGVLLVISSLKLDLGHFNNPGPGFMPLGSGILLTALCFAYGVQSIWMKDYDYKKKSSPWPRGNLEKIIGVLIALFLFTFLLTTLGYLLSTFLLMIFLFWVGDPEKWISTAIKAALTVLVSYIVFDKWLMIQFPRGFLGG